MTLVVTADLGGWKAYRMVQGPDDLRPHLELVSERRLGVAKRKMGERVTDADGRFPSGSGPQGGGLSLGERHERRREERRRCIQQLAGELAGLLTANSFGACWLAADRGIHRPLVEALPEAVRPRVRRHLPLDLTHEEPGELLRRFLTPP